MTKILVLSPHYDDALLSCGSFILDCAKKKYLVVILNIFTVLQSESPIKMVLDQLNQYGVTQSQFQKMRYREEKQAWKGIDINKYDLKLTDGAFRTIGGKCLYNNSEELFSGKIKNEDTMLTQHLEQTFALIEKKYNFDLVLSPFGVGKHADHIITKRAAQKVWQKTKLCFYIDQPYFSKRTNVSVINHLEILLNWKKMYFRPSREKILRLLSYSTQIPLLFSNARELFFTELLLLNRVTHFSSKNKIY